MKRRVSLLLALFAIFFSLGFSAAPLTAQKKPDRKALLQAYEKMAANIEKNDVDGHLTLAIWCLNNGLKTKAIRHLKRVLKIDPSNVKAHKLLGHVYFKGKWMTPKEKKKLVKKLEEERRKKLGLVKYKGKWVTKAEMAKMKAGFVKVGDQWYSPEDAKKIKAGYVRHPETGEWIKKEDLPKAQQGMFLVEGKWVSTQEADQYHSDWAHPWILTTTHYKVFTNLPWREAKLRRNDVEIIYLRLKNIMEGLEPQRAQRMNVYIFATQGDYNTYGSKYGTAYSSVSGGWFSQNDENLPAVCLWDKDFGKINLPHALALQYQFFLYLQAGMKDCPLWFYAGVACYCDRFYDAQVLRKWGAENIVRAGGVANYGRSWFSSFALSPDAFKASQKLLKDAGFLICYVRDSGDKIALKYWKQFWEGIKKGGKPRTLVRPIYRLESHLARSNKKIRAFFQKILTG